METMTKKCFHFFFVWKSVKLFLSKILCQTEKFQFNRMISETCPRAFATVASFQKLSNRNIDNLLTIDDCLNSFIHMHFQELVVFSHQYYFAYLYLEKLWRERERWKKHFTQIRAAKKDETVDGDTPSLLFGWHLMLFARRRCSQLFIHWHLKYR